MMSSTATRLDAPMDIEAFFAFLDGCADRERWELIDGRPVLMVGVTRAHSTITLNLATALHPIARGRGCETHASEFFASGDLSGFLAAPDVFVRCGPGDDKARFADDPVIVVEVLSPSTIRHDRVRKFDRYTAIASLRQIVLVYQDEVRVESFVREGENWPMLAHTSLHHSLALPPLEAELPLADIYAGTRLG